MHARTLAGILMVLPGLTHCKFKCISLAAVTQLTVRAPKNLAQSFYRKVKTINQNMHTGRTTQTLRGGLKEMKMEINFMHL